MATEDKNDHDDVAAANTSMISSTSPYQSTTEPVPHRRALCGGIIIDMKYIKSLPGILKVAEIVLNIIVGICLGVVTRCVDSCGAVAFLKGLVITAVLITILIYIIFAGALQSKISIIDWFLTDLLNAAIFSVLILIACIILITKSEHSADKAAIVFGLLLSVAYGISAWFSYRRFIIDRHKKKSTVSHVATEENEA